MSYKYSDSVSSFCGLQSSSTIDLVNWQEVRAHNTSWSPNTHTHTPFPSSPWSFWTQEDKKTNRTINCEYTVNTLFHGTICASQITADKVIVST